jgi:hypothetical protein
MPPLKQKSADEPKRPPPAPAHQSASDEPDDEPNPFASRPKIARQDLDTPAESVPIKPPANSKPKPIKPPIKSKPKPVEEEEEEDEEDDEDENENEEDENEEDDNDNNNEGGDESDNRAPCRYCKRKFGKEALARHEAICAKLSKTKKKKRVFDARQMRLAGTEAAKFAKGIDSEPVAKKKNFRAEHERLVRQLRQGRGDSGAPEPGGGKQAPPPIPDDDDRVSCPHCGRKFATDVLKKHVPSCERINGAKNGRGAARGKAGKK